MIIDINKFESIEIDLSIVLLFVFCLSYIFFVPFLNYFSAFFWINWIYFMVPFYLIYCQPTHMCQTMEPFLSLSLHSAYIWDHCSLPPQFSLHTLEDRSAGQSCQWFDRQHETSCLSQEPPQGLSDQLKPTHQGSFLIRQSRKASQLGDPSSEEGLSSNTCRNARVVYFSHGWSCCPGHWRTGLA